MIPSSYQNLFDKLAPHYRIIDFLSLGSTRYLRKAAIKKMNARGGTVIDLMCGTGNNISTLMKSGVAKYIGLDASAEMMYRARSRHLFSDRIEFRQCNVVHDLPEGLSADHIICTYGLKCLTTCEYDAFAESIDKLLKRGGTVSVLEFRMPENAVFRFLTSIYVNVFCGIVCLLVTGSLAPTRGLVHSMNPPIDPELLCNLLKKRNFDMRIEQRRLFSAVLIFGRKRDKYE